MKKKILFIYEHKYPQFWMDGLWAALNELEKDFEVYKWNIFKENHPDITLFDFILGWGGFNSPVDNFIQNLKTTKVKKGLCIAGNSFPAKGMMTYDVLFYETDWVRDYLELKYHGNIYKAFGVNTNIYFKPDIITPIVWDYIGVGAFASWKRWEKMLDKKGTRLVVGEYQNNNQEESDGIIKSLVKGGVMVSNMVSPYDLANLYTWSRTLYLPSTILGGGERAVLEARSCGLNIEVEDDNPKLKELIKLNPIPSHIDYAKKLKEGILSVF